jgi:hypothetical protein
MRLTLTVGFAAGVIIAAACSSNGNSNPLQSSSSGGGAEDAGCGNYTVSAATGQAYVQKEGCADCHGANLAGTSVAVVSGQEPGLTIIAGDLLYPPNLTPDKASGLGNWTASEIYYAITEGIDDNGETLCPEMGRHYPNMCASEANAIVAYLQSLPPVYSCIPQSHCPPLKEGAPASCPPEGTGGTDDGG